MQNVYDDLIDRGLIHIVSDRQIEWEMPENICKNTAVAVNLFYEDTLQKYFTYLDNIPKEIEVYIYSSNEKAGKVIAQYADRRSNMHFFMKENRGRDISAFLVAFREIALGKKFLCFLHDKREKALCYKRDTDYWIENLWGNTVCSEIYIKNILGRLNETSAGILTPPIPFGERFPYWYTNQWSDADFEITKELVVRMGLKCDIDKEKISVTLGSVFWCKTEAIRKLLECEWKYDDFADEPLPDDGTVSHAIERCFAYIAQDAGYTTEWVMSLEYAESLILKSHCQMVETYHLLKTNFIAGDLTELKRFDGQRKKIEEFCAECKQIYLYGAGVIGRKFAGWLYRWGLKIDGFVVTKKIAGQNAVLGMPVYEFKDIEVDETVGIIIATGLQFCSEIEATLKMNGITRYYKFEEKMDNNESI